MERVVGTWFGTTSWPILLHPLLLCEAAIVLLHVHQKHLSLANIAAVEDSPADLLQAISHFTRQFHVTIANHPWQHRFHISEQPGSLAPLHSASFVEVHEEGQVGR